jgi:aminoglycoside phosphotransferase (APT) family kinase protein
MMQKAERIAGVLLQQEILSVTPIIGKGIVNQIAVIETAGGKAVLRMNDSAAAAEEYKKEQWCIEQAGAAGIPGPEVLAVGKLEDTAYMMITCLDGDNGEDSEFPKSCIWRKLGEHASRLQTIRTEGYGELLSDATRGQFSSPPHDGFDGSWHSFVQYNIDSLTAEDSLLQLGVMTNRQSQQAGQRFARLRQTPFRFGLCHGDLSLKNTIVTKEGLVQLIDWGSAEAHLCPHMDLVQLLRSQLQTGRPDAAELQSLLEGCWIGGSEYNGLLDDLNALHLLTAFDKLRWALARRKDLIPAYAAYAKQVADLVLTD